MQLTWWGWLQFLVSFGCIVILVVAAGLAFRRLRRWSLAFLFPHPPYFL